MKTLVPCSGCSRHLNSDETVCPFCQAALVPQEHAGVCAGPCSGHRSPRLSRGALMAAGAALLCAACQSASTPVYGAPFMPDASRATVDAGRQADAGPDALPDAKK